MKNPDDIVDRAVAQMKQQSQGATIPSDVMTSIQLAVTRKTAESDPIRLAPIDDARKPFGRIWLSSTIAAVAVLAPLIFFSFSMTTVSAWERAMETVRKSDGVFLKIHYLFDSGETSSQDVTILKNRFRVDGIGGQLSWIVDQEKKEALIVSESERVYQMVHLSQGAIFPFPLLSHSLREDLLLLREQKPEFAGTDSIEGEQADHYVVKKGKVVHSEGNWDIWISRRTNAPVKVRLETSVRGNTTVIVYDSFQWDPVVDVQKLSVDPISGFTERELFRVVPAQPQPMLKLN